MSAGSGGPDGLDASSSRARPASVTTFRRIQVSKVWLSSLRGLGAVQGASSGTFFASRSSLSWACPMSASTGGQIRGIVPRVAAQLAVELDDVFAVVVGGERLDPEVAGQGRMRSWVGPTHWPPTSTTFPSPIGLVQGPAAHAVARLEHDTDRPPPAGRAPRSPASPAPTTTTSTSRSVTGQP